MAWIESLVVRGLDAVVTLAGGDRDRARASLVPLLPPGIAKAALRRWGAAVPEDTYLRAGLRIENAEHGGFGRLRIGAHCYIGCDCLIDVMGHVVLGDRVVLSPRVTVLSHQDVGNRPLASTFPAKKLATTLHADCWVGAAATVLAGVEIGEGAVVAAGAVVTKPLPPRTVVAGVPARVVRTLPDA